jgi:PAS domain S-box-containing protein
LEFCYSPLDAGNAFFFAAGNPVVTIGPYNPVVFILFLAGLISLSVAGFAWTRRRAPGGFFFVLLMLAVSWWAVMSALEIALIPRAMKLWAGKLGYLSIAGASVLWLSFALANGRRLKKIPQFLYALMWLVPVIVFVLAATNEWHGLVWPAIRPSSDIPGAVLVYSHGPVVWVNVVYTYLFMLIGTIILIIDALRGQSLYRRQAGWLIVGALFPWIGNAVYLSGAGPPGLDFTPIGFTFAGLFAAYSLFRYRFLDIVPVAHEALIDSIGDSIIVLDGENRILEMNPAARRLLGISSAAIGRSLGEYLKPWPDFAGLVSALLADDGERIVRWPEMNRWLDVRISRFLAGSGEVSGRLIVLRDVTALKTAEEIQSDFLDRIGRQKQAIVQLAFLPAISQGDLPAAARTIVETAARALRVERASIWLGSSEEGRFRCLDLFESSQNRHSEGRDFAAEDYPAYFRAIGSDRAVDAGDACADPRTAELGDGYLRPSGIASLLDAQVRAMGRLQGIVSFEHIGSVRAWRPDEVRFAAEIADQTAEVLQNKERRSVQERLQKREERLRFLMDNMVDIVSQLDADHKTVFVSPSVERVLGFSYHELLGKAPIDYIHPEDVERIRREIEKAGLTRESTIRLECRFRHRHGHYIWVESQTMIYYAPDGGFAGAIFSSRDISARRQAEEALRASLAEKDVLLKEVHHRVRNNMQVISSLLNHQARTVTDPAVLNMFRESQNRIRSIALVHEKLYRSSDLSRIDFADYIESLVVHLFQTLQIDGRRIAFRPELKSIELDVTTAIPLGLIVNELVMNSLVHAFPQDRSGVVSAVLDAPDEFRFRLRIADDGVGLPPGFDIARADSLGFQIVQMLVEQINATMAVRTEGGTSVEILGGRSKPLFRA